VDHQLWIKLIGGVFLLYLGIKLTLSQPFFAKRQANSILDTITNDK
jgi:threonine/homoserine/homoserine lactone efflux protein